MQSIRRRLSVATTAVVLAWTQLPQTTLAQSFGQSTVPSSGLNEAVTTTDARTDSQVKSRKNDELGNQAELRLSDLTLGAYPYEIRKNFFEAGSILIEPDSLIGLGFAGAMVVAARQFDTRAQDYLHDQSRLGPFEKLGNDILGTGVPGALLGAGLWLYGDLAGSSYETHAGQATIETLLTTGIVTAALKGAVGRERPDGSDRYSFPSGHTSTVFASASVLHQFYGWKLGVPSYALAAMTAASRISDNRHWFSDTVAGASLGILIGNAFSKMHLRRIEKVLGDKVALQVVPMPEPGGGRLLIKANF